MTSDGTNGSGAQSNIKRHQALDEVRQRIDALDDKLAPLIAERLALAKEVARVKVELNMPVKDSSREKDVLAKVAQASDDKLISDGLRTVYSEIFQCSRQIQFRDSAIAKGEPTYFPQVCIVGLGLIGGAIARLIKERVPDTEVIGVDLDEKNSSDAVALKLVDRVDTELKKAVSKASLVILAASPTANLSLLSELAPLLKKRQLVLDVTSVKTPILAAAEDLKIAADFVGGHPLFGSERSGATASQFVATEGTVFCLSPASKAPEMTVRRLIRWLSILGLKPDVMAANIHDHVMARTSHQVQLLSVALGMQLSDLVLKYGNDVVLQLCGPSFRQLARLMNSPSELWCQISQQNNSEIVAALQDTRAILQELSSAIERGDSEFIKNAFSKAKQVADLLLPENK